MIIDPLKHESVHQVMFCKIPFGNEHKLLSKYSGHDPKAMYPGGKIHWLYTIEEPCGCQITAMSGVCAGHNDYNEILQSLNENLSKKYPLFSLKPVKPVFRNLDGTLANLDPEYLEAILHD
jgi:hypothetical protein